MEYYQQNIQRSAATIASLKSKINLHAFARLGVILGGGGLIFLFAQDESLWAVMFCFFATLLLFFWLVSKQSRLEVQRKRWEAFVKINQHELTISEEKEGIYSDGSEFDSPQHPYVSDLDVFGKNSLFVKANRCATYSGQVLLANWMCSPAQRETILARQAAIQELAADPDWLQQLQVDLISNSQSSINLKDVLHYYVQNDRVLFGNKLLRTYTMLAPYLIGICFLGAIWLPILLNLGVWMMVLNLLLSFGKAGQVTVIGGRMERAGRLISTFSEAVARIEQRVWTSDLLRKLAEDLKSNGSDNKGYMSEIFNQLGVLLNRLDVRLNMLIGSLLNMVLLWDFRQVFALQEWQSKNGEEVLKALDIVAQFESLLSLSVLRNNHPHWCFPSIVAGDSCVLSMNQASHPLLRSDKAVANDFDNQNFNIALITGSNMAGKSTFLRTVGANVVLALCGAPVCAKQMEVSIMHLISYMRIKDSLQESTSTFKAELDRMKLILDTVKVETKSFFLIDEMLRGTNSVDKYKGSKAIIERLIQGQNYGIVATHDLQLALLEAEYPEVIENFNFDIQVRDGEMLFDYKLKEGACKVFNASMLLKGIGIDVDPSSTAH